MFCGFQIKDIGTDFCDEVAGGSGTCETFKLQERSLINSFSTKVKEAVAHLGEKDGVIDGDVLESAWYPQLKFDVFISHSHTNLDKAMALSAAIKALLGIDAFVDSCVWKCRDQLIEKLRELTGNNPAKPCANPRDESEIIAHADMMLNNSLMRMIDSCECLMFLDTPRSICRDGLVSKTFSAWLYSEIVISKYIRISVPERHRKCRRMLNEGYGPAMDSFALKISHGVDLAHLKQLTPGMFMKWIKTARSRSLSGRPALDPLYELVSLGSMAD